MSVVSINGKMFVTYLNIILYVRTTYNQPPNTNNLTKITLPHNQLSKYVNFRYDEIRESLLVKA